MYVNVDANNYGSVCVYSFLFLLFKIFLGPVQQSSRTWRTILPHPVLLRQLETDGSPALLALRQETVPWLSGIAGGTSTYRLELARRRHTKFTATRDINRK